ncbi:hotdog fold domain-containing protein [Mycobacterium sp. URHB0044]|jgi:acyl-coenzyme A thioesterase PaaI-like protein|uniref:hotdog fold domain-containing protein n=1 Tax=Mycobacterium sp. URHB0044 TaxID=1380386 RepID=UPI0009DF2557|nr:hotdog fold domain-containing protein [Mycobacterium sp. URHB0044]
MTTQALDQNAGPTITDKPTRSANLRLWDTLQRLPFGDRLFSQALCWKAPYFRSVHPRIVQLQPGLCRVEAPNRRSVHNHLGSFHAIASCNMAELAAGMMTDATIPPTHRWIPVGMTVEYKAKATTAVTSTARLDPLPEFGDAPAELVVPVDVCDASGEVFVTARITMHVSPKPVRKTD